MTLHPCLRISPVLAVLVTALGISIVVGATPALGEVTTVQFDRDIRPILTQKCLSCHGPDPSNRQADLRLDLERSAKAPRDDVPAIVPGKPQESGLYRRITTADDDDRMPPVDSGVELSREETELLRRWIFEGAEYQQHWGFEPVSRPSVPPVKQAAWPTNNIDRFVLARLEQNGMQPAPDADRRVLVRRLAFDLVGLPPTPAEVEAFVADESPDAYEKVVDRLLASPHFGERWARHWLDLVRYAETYGYEHDWPIPTAWRYRDYVIRMFNADVPFDQILREHVSGDLLKTPRRHPTEDFNESIIGTGFWFLHGQMSQPVDVTQHEADRFDNQIDVFSRAFVGLTIACARCHDHKFDPVSTEDYYGLLGFLRSSRRQEVCLDPQGQIASTVEQLSAIRQEADAALAKMPIETARPSDPTYDEAQDVSGTVLFEDFDAPTYGDWFVRGDAFGTAPTQPGQWDRTSAAAVPVRAGMAHSGMLAGKLRGTLQSREFKITHPRVWLRVAGKGKVRIIINGYMMQRYKDLLFEGTEIGFIVPPGEFKWIELDRELNLYLGHPAYLEIDDITDGHIVVDEIRFADRPLPKSKEAPKSKETKKSEGAKKSAKEVVKPKDEEAAPPSLVTDDDARFADWARRMEELNEGLPHPQHVLAICDGDPADVQVKIRGEVENLGVRVSRRLPLMFDLGETKPTESPEGSGRLAMAEQLLDRSNPLVARVRVNWVWHHLFGRGIVPTVDNLGTMGARPSHPKLLDYLADRFRNPKSGSSSGEMGHGWSMKTLIREMVLSRTYRMDSRPTDSEAERADPTNALLHRMQIRRLQGEAIRDAMLSVSGQLDTTQFGRSVPIHLTPFMQGLSRPEKSGPLDGNRRRSIYVEVRRNFLSPMFVTFDSPLPSTCVARRSTTNVPAQALILMNDPFVVQQANHWADRIMKQTANPRERIDRLYRDALSRPPRSEEVERAVRFLREQAVAYEIAPEAVAEHRPLWADLAHALFGVKEFIFVR